MPNWPGLAQQYHLALGLGALTSWLLTSPLHTVSMRCCLGQLVVQEWQYLAKWPTLSLMTSLFYANLGQIQNNILTLQIGSHTAEPVPKVAKLA